MTTRRTPSPLRVLSASLILTPLFFAAPSQAEDLTSAAIQSLPPVSIGTVQTPNTLAAPPMSHIYRVAAERTPSGFAVPRFVSLKFGKVNARTGPSRNHSIAYQYQRRGLPLIVVAETEMWRKVRDIHGDEAWVRKPALSGEQFAVLTTEGTLYVKPDPMSRTIARIESGALVHLEGCTDGNYCRVKTRNGIKGFMPRQVLWGAQDIN